MTYKAKIRIPKEQYAFIEVEVKGSVNEIKALYAEFMKEDIGLEPKEWNANLDNYLVNGQVISSDAHERMSVQQIKMIHELDKSNSRINNNNK